MGFMTQDTEAPQMAKNSQRHGALDCWRRLCNFPSNSATHMSLPRSSCSRDAVTTAQVSSHHRAHEEHVLTHVTLCMCSAPLCPRTLVEHVAFHTDNVQKDVCRCAEARDNFDTTSVPMEYGGAAATSEEKVQRFGTYYQRHSC